MYENVTPHLTQIRNHKHTHTHTHTHTHKHTLTNTRTNTNTPRRVQGTDHDRHKAEGFAAHRVHYVGGVQLQAVLILQTDCRQMKLLNTNAELRMNIVCMM
jgi:hypothetical protein